MAEVHPTQLSPDICTGRLAAPASAKARLRDSCHACASSKVKCHKEKPTCSRCAHRGVTCEYYVTKRPGRRRGHPNHNTNHDHQNTNKNRNKNKTQDQNSTTLNKVPPPSPSPVTPSAHPASHNHNHNQSYPDFYNNTTIPSTDSISASTSLGFEPLDLFSNLVSPNQSDPTLSSTPSLYTDQDSFFTSPFNLLEPDVSLDLTHDSHDLTVLSPNNNIFSVFGDAFPDHCGAQDDSHPLSSLSSSASTQAPSTTRENSKSINNENPSPPCCCLIRALGLIKHPLPNSSPRPACTMSKGPESCSVVEATVRTKAPDAPAIVAENAQIVEVISSILQCQCSEDSYLLTILALVAFKVLDWYEALARELPFSSSSSSSSPSISSSSSLSSSSLSSLSLSGTESLRREDTLSQSSQSARSSDMLVHQQHRSGYRADGEDLERMAAQLILSQLHRVQWVVNQLSPKLKSQGITMSKDGSTSDSQVSLAGQTSGGGKMIMITSSPFSAATLDNIEADLRKRLRGLSIKIIDMLRHV